MEDQSLLQDHFDMSIRILVAARGACYNTKAFVTFPIPDQYKPTPVRVLILHRAHRDYSGKTRNEDEEEQGTGI
jgi:hypothetical protein